MENPETVAAAVLAQLEEAFDASDDKMGVKMIAVGGILVDGCCDGLLVVAPEQVFLTSYSLFPTPLPNDDDCQDAVTGISLLVVANRCLVPVDQRGKAPRAALQEPVYSMVLRDAAQVWKVLAGDAVLGQDSVGDVLWQRGTLGQLFTADGSCVGSETRVTFGVPGTWCE